MTWLLVSTVCVVFGPADARCETQSKFYRTKAECAAMMKPQKEYLTSEAAAIGIEYLHLFVGCKFGRVT